MIRGGAAVPARGAPNEELKLSACAGNGRSPGDASERPGGLRRYGPQVNRSALGRARLRSCNATGVTQCRLGVASPVIGGLIIDVWNAERPLRSPG
jgi:hypothetical protein